VVFLQVQAVWADQFEKNRWWKKGCWVSIVGEVKWNL